MWGRIISCPGLKPPALEDLGILKMRSNMALIQGSTEGLNCILDFLFSFNFHHPPFIFPLYPSLLRISILFTTRCYMNFAWFATLRQLKCICLFMEK